jgi:hypothetical protein
MCVAEKFNKLPHGKWIPSAAFLLVSYFLLAGRGSAGKAGRLQRIVAYASIAVSLFIGAVAYFFAGGFGDLRIGPIPAGTPVNLLANVNPDTPKWKLKAALRDTIEGLTEIQTRHFDAASERAIADPKTAEQVRKERETILRTKVARSLMEVSKCPDFVMDEGHYFPWFNNMTDADKEALIELLKTF